MRQDFIQPTATLGPFVIRLQGLTATRLGRRSLACRKVVLASSRWNNSLIETWARLVAILRPSCLQNISLFHLQPHIRSQSTVGTATSWTNRCFKEQNYILNSLCTAVTSYLTHYFHTTHPTSSSKRISICKVSFWWQEWPQSRTEYNWHQ